MKIVSMALLWAVFLAVPSSYAKVFAPELPPEPPIINNDPLKNPLVVDATYDWRTNLFYIFYDLDQNGNVDYMTARRVERVSQNEYSNTVVELVAEHPLFYWLDVNNDHQFKHEDNEIWVDPEEDGVNGNEVQYHLQEQGFTAPKSPQ